MNNSLRDARPDEQDTLLSLFRRYAKSSTSFLTLYDGYRYFSIAGSLSSGLIPYLETPHAWVGAGDPVANPEEWPRLLAAFREEAAKKGKSVLILPASEATSKIATTLGYRSYYIGAEPWHEVSSPTNNTSPFLQLNPARQLYAKGASVELFDPETISASDTLELQDVVRSWIENRKSDPLGFLNRLEPWTLSRYKRYYMIKHQGKIQGFLASVPIFADNSWYLVDLIRRPSAPLGTTELLVIEAMKDLKRLGASRMTLGFSPLARIEDQLRRDPPKGSSLGLKACKMIFEHGNIMYGFKSLYDYKAKFAPETWESKYLLSAPGGIALKETMALSTVLYPRGILSATLATARKTLNSFHPTAWIPNQLSKDLMLRPFPLSFADFFQRVRIALLFSLLSIFLFFGSTDPSGHIRLKMLDTYGIAYDNLFHHATYFEAWRSLLISPLLFLNVPHLLGSIFAIAVVVGFLELAVGTVFTVSCFLVGSFAVWPLIAGIDLLVFSRFFPAFHQTMADVHRVGPTLGIAACLGACNYLFDGARKLRWAAIAIAVISVCILDTNYSLSHLLSFGLGYFWISQFLHKRDPLSQ
jgi:hypothetical protein